MRSRRAQFRAYRFVTRRIVTALVGGDPESADPPFGRSGLTTLASTMIGATMLAGFGVYGLVRPGGNTSWRQPGSLIVEQGTGARFVYRQGLLHPVLNDASARLLIGTARVRVVTVPASSLSGVARGRAVGIPGGPEELPGAAQLLGLPWSVCAAHNPAEAAAPDPLVTVLVGTRYPGARPLRDLGLLVSAKGSGRFLVWHGERLRSTAAALSALGWAAEPAMPVAPGFLKALPAGPDLTPKRLPARRPALVSVPDEAGPAVCVSYRSGGTATVEMYQRAPGQLTSASGDTSQPSRVLVPGGHGALVQPTTAGGTPDGRVTFLVTDQGIRYRVPDAKARTALGYGDVTPVPVPEAVLGLVPAGPVLSTTAAVSGPAAASPAPSRSGR
jgi:Type VII secretion system ESX-1, transport TM domain B